MATIYISAVDTKSFKVGGVSLVKNVSGALQNCESLFEHKIYFMAQAQTSIL